MAAVNALWDCLQRVCGRSNSPVLMAGDCNFPGYEWTKTVTKNCAYPHLHNNFIDIISDNGLTQIVDIPTRQGSVPDLIITNRPSQINRTDTVSGIACCLYCRARYPANQEILDIPSGSTL